MKHKYKLTFLEREDADFYYILGAFMTDGSVYFDTSKRSYRAYLYSNDLEWLERINKYFCDTNCIYKNRKCFALTISSKQIVSKLIDKGCIQNKSLTLQFPIVPKEFLPDFIRGCLDGDGTIGIFKNKKYFTPHCCLCSSSLLFIKSYINVLINYDIPYSFITSLPKLAEMPDGKFSYCQYHYVVKIANINKVKEFLNIIYYDNCNFVMKRKSDIVNKIRNLPDANRHTNSNLNDKQVIEIINLYSKGLLTQKDIGEKYNVTRQCINRVLTGRTWNSLTKICKKKK